MKVAILFLLICVSPMAFAQDAKPASPADKSFDGTWAVTLVVPDHTDANGTALGFTFRFTAQVKDGVLHGEYGTKGASPSLSLDGRINTDGSADLSAKGITGKPTYSLQNVSTGTPYTYQVKARFDGSKGTGTRVKGRVGNFTFVKQ